MDIVFQALEIYTSFFIAARRPRRYTAGMLMVFDNVRKPEASGAPAADPVK